MATRFCEQEMIMNNIKLTFLAAAVVVGIPLASAFAAQRFGGDDVSMQGGEPVCDVPSAALIKRLGRESLFFVTDDVPIARPDPDRFTAATLKPGRA
jgi:hypothetical protein